MFKTQVEWAVAGTVIKEMEMIAETEQVLPEFVREKIARGQIVVPLNKNRPARIVGIGKLAAVFHRRVI